ncbi:hypothetical protein AYO20_00615 [Fonsecaea nubica]|uniref:Uncharacterized protein n=1 Tax=Fonsecaea nubica TaxID=856822 RepID=A0A178DGL8_9EURO|nr:hypothetical protein AYO20_00615 [Fonsecaea nubica]OAL40195.1 hypothetical protein AYO20_00615 [Fonsecaea nubica]
MAASVREVRLEIQESRPIQQVRVRNLDLAAGERLLEKAAESLLLAPLRFSVDPRAVLVPTREQVDIRLAPRGARKSCPVLVAASHKIRNLHHLLQVVDSAPHDHRGVPDFAGPEFETRAS